MIRIIRVAGEEAPWQRAEPRGDPLPAPTCNLFLRSFERGGGGVVEHHTNERAIHDPETLLSTRHLPGKIM